MKKIIFGILMVAFAKTNAQIITDRPTQTESSSTVGFGDLQIESGYLVAFQNDIKSTIAPVALFRYGIAKGIEIRVLSQFETSKQNEITTKGISDLQIGTKIQILNNKDVNTKIAFSSQLALPTGSQGFGSNQVGSINRLSFSHSINNTTGIGYGIGYDYLGTGKGSAVYSVSLGKAINDKVGIYIEPYGIYENLNNHISNIDSGFTYLKNDHLQFDFSFGTGINQNYNYIAAGVSWLIERP